MTVYLARFGLGCVGGQAAGLHISGSTEQWSNLPSKQSLKATFVAREFVPEQVMSPHILHAQFDPDDKGRMAFAVTLHAMVDRANSGRTLPAPAALIEVFRSRVHALGGETGGMYGGTA